MPFAFVGELIHIIQEHDGGRHRLGFLFLKGGGNLAYNLPVGLVLPAKKGFPPTDFDESGGLAALAHPWFSVEEQAAVGLYPSLA